MKIQTFILSYSKTELINDLIVDKDRYWIINEQKEMICNNQEITKLDDTITLSFPFFSQLNEENFIIIDGDCKKNVKNNAWVIINKYGKLQNSFFIGRGVTQVVVQDKNIVIAYSDSMIDACSMGTNRLVCFDFKGKIKYTFDDKNTLEVKAICNLNKESIIVQEYPSNDILILNKFGKCTRRFKTNLDCFVSAMIYQNGSIYAIISKRTNSISMKDWKNILYKSEQIENKLFFTPILTTDYHSKVKTNQENNFVLFDNYFYNSESKTSSYQVIDIKYL